MKFNWNKEKSDHLLKERGFSFDEIVAFITAGGLLDVIEHPNKKQYPDQQFLVVHIHNYIYYVPCVIEKDGVFLKTYFPSRKATKKYLGELNNEEKNQS